MAANAALNRRRSLGRARARERELAVRQAAGDDLPTTPRDPEGAASGAEAQRRVQEALLALMMSMPIPLTNTAPSFVIFVLAAGLLEEDGLAMIAGLLLAPVAAAIAGLAIYWGVTYGPEAVETTLKPMIKQTLGLGG